MENLSKGGTVTEVTDRACMRMMAAIGTGTKLEISHFEEHKFYTPATLALHRTRKLFRCPLTRRRATSIKCNGENKRQI